MSRLGQIVVVCALVISGIGKPADAGIVSVTVEGPDAIFLAGRTDVVIPDASAPWTGPGTFLTRHGGPTPEEAQESMPPFVSVSSGDVIRLLNPAVGGINFFNGLGPPYFGPEGNGLSGSNLTAIDGISGYLGPQGALAGVFLDDSIPNTGPAPVRLDFTPGGLGTNFTTLSPLLRQIFFIGDGVDALDNFQTFIAPLGATRLFLAIPDGFGFVGHPGAYDDNDGAYRVILGINEIPRATPEPASLALGLIGSFALLGYRRRSRSSRATQAAA